MTRTTITERSREVRRLSSLYQRDRDPAARVQLVRRFLPLARQLARRYKRGSEPLDDLVQVASLGLLKAIDGFDPTRGSAFSTTSIARLRLEADAAESTPRTASASSQSATRRAAAA